MNRDTYYDLIVLGTGLGGTMLAAIMARHGRRVLLIDAGSHPRFAIGEATTPDTSFRLKLLAAKYDVPELAYLSEFYLVRDHIGASSGVKRAFSFLYHRPGQAHEPTQSHQFPTGAPPWGPDCHLFRQDTDAFMLAVAARHGAQVRQTTRVSTIDLEHERGVAITTDKGERFTAAFLVDAAGFRSPLATQLELRDEPTRLRTNSRAIFTHMVGVSPYDRVGEARDAHGLVYPLSQTTLHHVFEGGWLWVIPFDNHLDAVNQLTSVGLLLDRELHPETGKDAEQEFFEHVQRMPGVARQFEGARALRGWVSTGRLQYSSRQTVGDRWLLLAHAAGFVDPLYSSGLNLTVGVIDLFADELLAALDDGDFTAARFAHVDTFFQTNLELYDEFVANSYLGWRDYELWDAWYRVWVAALQVGTYLNGTQLMRHLESGDRAVLERSREAPFTSLLGTAVPECQRLVGGASAHMHRFARGEITAASAAANIRALLREVDFCPSYWRLDDPSVRTTPPYTMTQMLRAYVWYHRNASPNVRELMVGFKPLTASRHVLSAFYDNSRRGLRRQALFMRDSLRAWNRDWRDGAD
ncbi:NAD(P)/FAD-dependent oxidoreductase [Enhygromyxa salina]|uniref:N-methyltryptophan oxidase n=1 Tax=Enhygromyxa salina TaxID=215803 RepID=A0A2S9YV73_9BACT|nr:tryptophan 7-halogenase [Enhygromyxa salina]PRQ08998.1 N-methyltryptophan oxidase [Enhygromyxa salina]